jgi:hypothetical protein
MNKKGVWISNNRGQIWVETVIYTLIAFAMIGLVLVFVKPKIEEIRDKAVIEQSIDVLKEIDSIISTIGDPGNQREVRLGINKGVLNIDSTNNIIFFEIESKSLYSQLGEELKDGDVIVLTEKKAEFNLVTLTSDYNATHDLTYDGTEELKSLSKAPTPYKLLLLSAGKDNLNRTTIDLRTGN